MKKKIINKCPHCEFMETVHSMQMEQTRQSNMAFSVLLELVSEENLRYALYQLKEYKIKETIDKGLQEVE